MRQGKKKRRRMSEKENSNQFLLLCSVCSKRTGVHGPEKGLGLRPLFFTFLFRLYIYPALLLPSSYPLKKRLRGGLATRLSSFFFVNRQELFFFYLSNLHSLNLPSRRPVVAEHHKMRRQHSSINKKTGKKEMSWIVEGTDTIRSHIKNKKNNLLLTGNSRIKSLPFWHSDLTGIAVGVVVSGDTITVDIDW